MQKVHLNLEKFMKCMERHTDWSGYAEKKAIDHYTRIYGGRQYRETGG